MRLNFLSLQLVAQPLTVLAAGLLGIPTVPFNSSTPSGVFSLGSITRVLVDPAHASAVDDRGETLIPPTLQDFATTFASDIGSVLGTGNVSITSGTAPAADAIFITLSDSPSSFLSASGAETSEGYLLNVTSDGITIKGASPLGAWWATRTLLQQAVLSNGSIPLGSGFDSPGWAWRGLMLDGGRHYYPPEFIIEMCAYLSFFKQNTLHLHLSDNFNYETYYGWDWAATPGNLNARFRLWSDDEAVAGLNLHQNESYTRDTFNNMQRQCVARGVTILPEIEVPGHALVMVQWKPEIGLSSDPSLLNITHPDTIPTIKTIFSTFMDWFHSKTMHIGADEYTGPAEDYNTLVNTMASYIPQISNKSIRIWGTYPPKDTYANNIPTNVSIQHWEFFEDNPLFDYIANNYSVLNSDDTYYVVNKYSQSYPPSIPFSKSFTGNPATGGLWYPYVFDTKNATNNPERDNPLVLGALAALWNDFGPNATTYLEAFRAVQPGLPALADKQWGGDLDQAGFEEVFGGLQGYGKIPGQNLARDVVSKGDVIVEYVMNGTSENQTGNITIHDLSGNGYDATTACSLTNNGTLAITPTCSLSTPLSSKGQNYTLTLSLKLDAFTNGTTATLLAGRDTTLLLVPEVAFFQGGNLFPLRNGTTTLPVGEWTKLEVIARGNRTFASIGGSEESEFTTIVGGYGQWLVEAEMALEAPLGEIGGWEAGWTGEVKEMKLTSTA